MNRLNNIYIATFSSKAEEAAKKFGFGIELNDLCISSNLEPEKRTQVIDRMQGELERAGANNRKTIMHGPFTELTPAAIDSRSIDLMRDRYLSTISICEEMGIHDLVLHDGYIPLIYQKPWHLKRSIAFWTEFAENIPEGFRIYIENVFDDEPDLLSEIVETVNDKLGTKAGSEKYLICLDIGHANALVNMTLLGKRTSDALDSDDSKEIYDSTEDVLRWIDRMGQLIGHFHLHNNDGSGDQHDDIDSGSFDIDRVLAAIDEKCRPDATMTIESRNALPSAEYLYNYYSRLSIGK